MLLLLLLPTLIVWSWLACSVIGYCMQEERCQRGGTETEPLCVSGTLVKPCCICVRLKKKMKTINENKERSEKKKKKRERERGW